MVMVKVLRFYISFIAVYIICFEINALYYGFNIYCGLIIAFLISALIISPIITLLIIIIRLLKLNCYLLSSLKADMLISLEYFIYISFIHEKYIWDYYSIEFLLFACLLISQGLISKMILKAQN